MISNAIAKKIVATGVTRIGVRSILGCKCKVGACSKCYGMGLATRKRVNLGEAVGIIAAQSIGEPGTQLTMRTFHTGGVAGGDITQGLPRVEELFEARNPKGLAIITEISGTVQVKEEKKRKEVVVVGEDDAKTYVISFGSKLCVKDGDKISAGDPITVGSINPADLLAIKGPEGVYEYIISEVQKVYRNQGVDINDKHIEVITSQMLRKVRIEDPGDSGFYTASLVDLLDFEEKNKELEAEGKRPATGKRALLGITKASLATESFLSAASFQETTRVLTEAAIKGKVDNLTGIKENVIIGKLIPTGTGLKHYQDLQINTKLVQKKDDEADKTDETLASTAKAE
jgi:DNA-directed RNA polymerase subunit beta'